MAEFLITYTLVSGAIAPVLAAWIVTDEVQRPMFRIDYLDFLMTTAMVAVGWPVMLWLRASEAFYGTGLQPGEDDE